MGDSKILYDEAFGINTFNREIIAELGEEFWNKLVEGMILPEFANMKLRTRKIL